MLKSLRSPVCLAITALLLLCSMQATQAQVEKYPERAWSMITKLQPGTPSHTTTPLVVPIAPGDLPPQNEPDVRVRPTTNTTQSEMSIAVSPLNNRVALASANASDFPVSVIYGTSAYWSTDAGLTWAGFDQPPSGNANSGDPAAAIDRNGYFFIGSIANNDGQGVMRSTDGGTTWNYFQVSNPNGSLLDKNHLTVDANSSSPHVNNVYSAWTDFGQPDPNPIEFARSTNNGATWVSEQNISGTVMTASEFGQGVHLQTGPNGEVYAIWSINQGTSPFTERAIGFNVSLDGGATWGPGSRAITNTLGIRTSSFGTYGIRSNSFPVMAASQITGHLYIVWTNIGVPGVNTGDPDIYLIKSTNGGTSWGTPVRVNTDAIGNNANQWFPWISVDPETDQVSVAFMDGRSNIGTNLAEAWVAHSIDGGATFEDFVVSDAAFAVGPLPGFGGNYAGDYIGIASRGARAYPFWSAQNPSTNAQGWVSPVLFADPTDPNPPTGVTAYSDFSTPTSMALSWTNPTTLVNGTPIGSFVIRIKRDGTQIAEVTPPTNTYNDSPLATYTEYTYTFETRLTSNDSLSTASQTSWTAGGSPFPGAPTSVGIVITSPRSTQAEITWTNPTTQKDGTPVHDFAGTQIWRNGVLVDSVGPAITTYTDTPPQGFVYNYILVSFNSLVPRRYSDPSASVGGYIGDVPDVLIWQPVAAISPSGDSLVASLTRLGISNFKVDDLFYFGSDLSVFNAIFTVVGIYSDNHVIGASDPEGAALDTYVQNGGNLYLEGGDVFNYDPESASGYQVRPIFGLNDGADGGTDVTSVNGLTVFNGLSFSYNGGNNFMDELHPNSDGAGRTLWVAPGSTPANDTMGVFHFYGLGRSVASVVEFGGLVDAGANLKDSVLAKMWTFFNQALSAPEINVTPTALDDTLQAGQSRSLSFAIQNTTPPPANGLIVSINESVSWLSVNPAADTISGASSATISVDLDATGLTPGNYSTNVVVTSNDADEPTTNVPVSLLVTGSPTLVTSPDSIAKTMTPNTTAVETLIIKNTGAAVLNWTIADIPSASAADNAYVPQTQGDVMFPPRVGRDGWPIPLAKGEKDIHTGPPVTEGQGGPDSAGYRWIDSDEPGGPTFNWVDISSSGTLIDENSPWIPTGTFTGPDEGYIQIPLPFGFQFYGTTYTSAYISSNGLLMFQIPTANNFTNTAIPTAGGSSDNFLAAFWDDLEIINTSQIFYGNNGADFVVQFVNIHRFNGTVPEYTFQYILKPGGQFLFQYQAMSISGGTLTSHTTGIENVGGTVGLQIAHNPATAYLHNSLAILIGKDVSWLSENPTSGTVNPGDSAIVALTFDTNGLIEAVYTAKLEIVSNDFANNPKHIPVRLTVADTGSAASITVTSPNGGETWVVGSSHNITWNNTGIVDSVKIEFSSNNGTTWSVIAGAVVSNGSYSWSVPNSPTAQALVRVTWVDSASVTDQSNATFTIAQPVVTEAFADHVTSTLRASVTNEGNIGSLNAFVGQGPGSGFRFNPATTTGQRLFEGSIMIGLDSTRVSDAARNNIAPEAFDADFKFAGNLDSSLSSGLTRIITTSYNDSLAETPFGVRVVQKSVSWDTAGLNSFLIMQLDLHNTTATSYPSLAVGGYFDWDVNPTNAQDRGSVIVDSTNNIPGVISGNSFPFDMLELHQGAAPNSWMGIVPLNENRFLARRIAIQSSEVFPPRMTNADKWLYMTTNRPTNPNGDAGSNVDHGQVFGMGPYTIGPGATQRVGFALVAGTSLQNFINTARAAQRAWVQRLGNSINVILVGVDEPVAELPATFILNQNFPNPFNPSTRIEFGLPEQSEVSLRVYNLLGQEVRVLTEGTHNAGFLTVEWDGKTANGIAVSSGMYFYRLEARSSSGDVFTSLRKMILIK
ncbi:MAG: FlgD immunoglobulin-like domain containing protein [Bacteroidota bacterium]